LLEREVIDATEVKLLMEGKPLPEKGAHPAYTTSPRRAQHRSQSSTTRTSSGPGFTRGENPAKA